ncbi:putative fatty acyl-CoA reductase CG5065 [Diachasma alloeum]|uniref:putative fatty acyl-CoA reductase CG5065 n=1 Tax=Diachasma alloeum TaxID=454923 RepID=UPI000738362C|nr:putative fatty acyl-CoA reductase CG5065 [Diachasma alloeum]XP_015117037.1 putative fatty acyl-CoA reductase CG5065 [Diachasma alloeum]
MRMGTPNSPTEEDRSGHEEINPGGTSVEAFFAASVVFITGVTGFLGKALLEKLLRACPEICTIYVLIRPKKNWGVQERFESLFDNPVFDRIKSECPSAVNKVIAVSGDVSLPNLGLSEKDCLMLTQRVNVVFHSAATVRFDEPLKVAVDLNAKGTERMIDFCAGMMNLVSFVHVSTAYSNLDRTEVKEIIYRANVKSGVIIDMCDNLDDETLRILEEKLRGKHPNTYTLTKRLAENIIMTKGNGLPLAIVRPSIVCAAYQEPFPGWIDNVSGITGIMTEISRGTIRSVICNQKLVADIIPLDYVVDTLICVAWYRSMHPSNTIQVYNCVSSIANPLIWRTMGELVNKYVLEFPSKHVLWYPGFSFRTNKFMHSLIAASFHRLPAYIADLILKIRGAKPIMVKIAKRLERAAQTGEFFSFNEWQFRGENMQQLIRTLKTSDSCSKFNVDIATLDWDTYFRAYILGIREYILKDCPDTLTNARNRLSKLYWIHKLSQVLVSFVLIKMILRVGQVMFTFDT